MQEKIAHLFQIYQYPFIISMICQVIYAFRHIIKRDEQEALSMMANDKNGKFRLFCFTLFFLRQNSMISLYHLYGKTVFYLLFLVYFSYISRIFPVF